VCIFLVTTARDLFISFFIFANIKRVYGNAISEGKKNSLFVARITFNDSINSDNEMKSHYLPQSSATVKRYFQIISWDFFLFSIKIGGHTRSVVSYIFLQ
jgi:hypothetical protein